MSESTSQQLHDRLAALGVLDPSSPLSLVSRGDDWALYISGADSIRYAVKHFTNPSASPITPNFRRADERAAAEATGLRIYEPRNLAPRLIWHGDLADPIGGSVVVYHWFEGNTIGQRGMAAWEVDIYADALRAVHTGPLDLNIISPRPRNLDAWWYETHERYRELPPDLLEHLPGVLRDDLTALAQAIAPDVQTHKRYWQAAPLLPVHGYPLPHNFIIKDRRPILVDWQRFGLGDPSLEVGIVSGMMARYAGNEAADRLVAQYLENVEDATLAQRIEIYRRVWPFSRVLYLLASFWKLAHGRARVGTPLPTLHYWSAALQFQLRRSLETYGWSRANTERTLEASKQWLDALAMKAEAQG